MVLRRCGTAVAALALLFGFSAAPFTHAHHDVDSVNDEHHPPGGALVHTHASPHAPPDADHSTPEDASDEDRGERIWSVESFVFQQPIPQEAPAPVLCVVGEPYVQPVGPSLSACPPQPRAHGPPVGSPPSGLRAPPAFLPPHV